MRSAPRWTTPSRTRARTRTPSRAFSTACAPADLTNYNAWFDAQLDIEPIATATDLFDEGRSCITRLWRKRKIVQSPILVTVWRWKARSDCGLLPLLQTGSSELSWTGGWKVGSTCLALPGGDCVSRGRQTITPDSTRSPAPDTALPCWTAPSGNSSRTRSVESTDILDLNMRMVDVSLRRIIDEARDYAGNPCVAREAT